MNIESSVAAGGSHNDVPSSISRRAARAAWLGFFVDMFDIYLPIIVLAPAIQYFEPPKGTLSKQLAMIIFSLIYASTLLGRPLGSLIFGWLSDRIGRRPSTLIAVIGFGTITLLIACMPGYATIGIASLFTLIFLRFVAGILLAGEYTGAMPLAMEYSPRDRRAVFCGLIMTSFPAAYIAISASTYLLLQIIPSGGLHSAYTQWGWRLPFLVGALIAYSFAFFWYRRVPESESWRKVRKTENPLLALTKKGNRSAFIQVFILVSGLWFLIYMLAAVVPGTLSSVVHLTHTQVTFTMMIAFVIIAIFYVLASLVAHVIGRRPFYILCGFLAVIGGTGFYLGLISIKANDIVSAILLTAGFGICVAVGWSIMPAYLNERFHTSIRASGFGVSYSLSVIIPSFFAFYQVALAHIMPASLTPIPLTILGGVLLGVGAYLGPETRNVDLSHMGDT